MINGRDDDEGGGTIWAVEPLYRGQWRDRIGVSNRSTASKIRRLRSDCGAMPENYLWG